jgi:phosphoglycerol transferase MdoB-like AlkP superfamily enzyme
MSGADAIGLSVLAVEMVVAALVFYSPAAPALIWIVISIAFAIAAVLMWRSEKSPKSPSEWFLLAIGSVVLGCIFFVCDVWVGSSGNPNLSILDTARRAGGPFGFGLTLIVCPATTFISLAGMARAYYEMKRSTREQKRSSA